MLHSEQVPGGSGYTAWPRAYRGGDVALTTGANGEPSLARRLRIRGIAAARRGARVAGGDVANGTTRGPARL